MSSKTSKAIVTLSISWMKSPCDETDQLSQIKMTDTGTGESQLKANHNTIAKNAAEQGGLSCCLPKGWGMGCRLSVQKLREKVGNETNDKSNKTKQCRGAGEEGTGGSGREGKRGIRGGTVWVIAAAVRGFQ